MPLENEDMGEGIKVYVFTMHFFSALRKNKHNTGAPYCWAMMLNKAILKDRSTNILFSRLVA